MLSKNNRRFRKALIQKLAENPGTLTLQVRILVTAMNKFQLQLKSYRELLRDLKVFSPLEDYVDEIDNGLIEGVFWILDCVDDKISLTELMSNLKNDTAQGLETNLNMDLTQCCSTAGETSIIVQDIYNDVDSLCERVREEIRVKGFELYSVLIGAA